MHLTVSVFDSVFDPVCLIMHLTFSGLNPVLAADFLDEEKKTGTTQGQDVITSLSVWARTLLHVERRNAGK